MIQANELRIGNWVNDTRTVGDRTGLPEIFHPRQVIKIDEDYFRYYNPIELTPEILEKCGFVPTGIDNHIYSLFLSEFDSNELSRQRIDFFTDNTHGKVELCRSGVCFKMCPCQYIHQLQNLYFALTGEELNIQL